MPRRSSTDTPPRRLRCAIYTRKSTEEGLDQDFNTLDAQREAGEAYVRAQRHEGWDLVPTRYDDGGFTGANLERPALQRLLADVELGLIDVIVVYKVDRLSRSLIDFSKLAATLEEHDVAFVSVTQQFNTASSMGRLMLNVLLSFAQFERETIAERTRDKMRAARRKGKWTGGTPMLGYDTAPEGGRLVVNEAEADQVREIYETYCRVKSIARTVQEIDARGWRNKSWITKKGRLREGARFSKSSMGQILKHPIYIGCVRHDGQVLNGEHEGIVTPELFQRVQRILAHNAQTCGTRVRNKWGALLKDLLRCGHCDAPMVHTTSGRREKQYRYYVCNHAREYGWAECPTPSLPAGEVERFVVERIRAIGADDTLVGETLAAARGQTEARVAGLRAEVARAQASIKRLETEHERTGDQDLVGRIEEAELRLAGVRDDLTRAEQETVDEDDLRSALTRFDPVWDTLFPKERARIAKLLLEQVVYDGEAGTLALTFRPGGIRALSEELGGDDAEAQEEAA